MKPNFKVLDGLRGIAATYVVVNHSRGNLLIVGSEYAKIVPTEKWSLFYKMYYSVLQITVLGREFVILFFILSGFSIAYSLQKKTNVIQFYRRRLIRLYPPYIFALAWAALCFYIVKIISPQLTVNKISIYDMASVFSTFKSTFLNMVYIPNGAFIPQFWSLRYEVVFYLLVPFLILNKRLYYFSSILIYAISIFINWQGLTGSNIIMQYIFHYNIFFAMGVWLFHNFNKVESKVAFKKNYIFYFSSIILILAMIVTKFKLAEYDRISLFLASLFSVILIVNFINKGITNKVLFFLGNMSYTIYITHFASIYLFKAVLIKMGIVSNTITAWYIWPIGVCISLFVSYLFFQMAENPSKKILNKIRNSQ